MENKNIADDTKLVLLCPFCKTKHVHIVSDVVRNPNAVHTCLTKDCGIQTVIRFDPHKGWTQLTKFAITEYNPDGSRLIVRYMGDDK